MTKFLKIKHNIINNKITQLNFETADTVLSDIKKQSVIVTNDKI